MRAGQSSRLCRALAALAGPACPPSRGPCPVQRYRNPHLLAPVPLSRSDAEVLSMFAMIINRLRSKMEAEVS